MSKGRASIGSVGIVAGITLVLALLWRADGKLDNMLVALNDPQTSEPTTLEIVKMIDYVDFVIEKCDNATLRIHRNSGESMADFTVRAKAERQTFIDNWS